MAHYVDSHVIIPLGKCCERGTDTGYMDHENESGKTKFQNKNK